MEKYHYVKSAIDYDGYIDLDNELSEDIYDNIGSTYEDYVAGKFVLLSDEQFAFHLDNPSASVKEVFAMQLEQAAEPSEEEVIAALKEQKLHDIVEYSHSDAVDLFTINGVIQGWRTPAERANYLQSLTSAELLGEQEVDFFVGKNFFTLDLHSARLVLARIQRYADASFIVTERKKLELETLQTAEEVIAFDVTSGYPDRLNFDFVVEDDSSQEDAETSVSDDTLDNAE